MSADFSERSFYLEEFRGRTLGVAARSALLEDSAWLAPVLEELRRNATRVVLVSDAARPLALRVGSPVLPAAHERLEGAVWRQLRASGVAGVQVPEGVDFASACADAALRLRLSKLVVVDPGGGIHDAAGRRLSFADLAELRSRPIDAERGALLREVARLVDAGVAAVNLCTPAGLDDELFTYAGSGTLVTRERYLQVRRLGVDDYDAAHDLVARGVREGYLAPRDEAALDRVLAGALGAFVEARHLAGIAALEPLGEGVEELASLYTLTRFLGEGVGAYLVQYAVDLAQERGTRWVVACTTAERVGAFFERQGFAPVSPDSLPAARWTDYDPERRARLRCYRRVLQDGF